MADLVKPQRPVIEPQFCFARIITSDLTVDRRGLAIVLELAGDICPEGGVEFTVNGPGNWSRLSGATPQPMQVQGDTYRRGVLSSGLGGALKFIKAINYAHHLLKFVKPEASSSPYPSNTFVRAEYRVRVWAETRDRSTGAVCKLTPPKLLSPEAVNLAALAAWAEFNRLAKEGFIYDPHCQRECDVKDIDAACQALEEAAALTRPVQEGKAWLI